MKKKALLIAFHSPVRYSSGTAALVRRVEHYALALIGLGYSVDMITAKSEYAIEDSEKENLFDTIYYVPEPKYSKFIIKRKLDTLLNSIYYGDYTGKEFAKFSKLYPDFKFHYSIMISFFTPRGPIYTGFKINEKYTSNWVIDFQDTYDEGIPRRLAFINRIWTKQKTKNANHLIHVSSEWGIRDARALNRQFKVFRHVITEKKLIGINSSADLMTDKKILYAGNIHFKEMDVSIFFETYPKLGQGLFSFVYAGSDNVFSQLKSLYPKSAIEFAGFLNKEELEVMYLESSVVLILTWEAKDRMVIPSKFYEACSYQKPILIVGKDSGAFRILFDEWGHPDVLCDTSDKISIALSALAAGSTEKLFTIDKCTKQLPTFENFQTFISSLL